MEEQKKYWLGICVQVVLAVAAIWYSLETRCVRKQNEGMLELLSEEARISVAPDLITGIRAYDETWESELKSLIINDTSLTNRQREESLSGLETYKDILIFVGKVANISDNIAHNVNLYVYDVEHKSFLGSWSGKELMEGGAEEKFFVVKPYLFLEEIKDDLTSSYGGKCEFIFKQLAMGNQSYVLTVYTDVAGRVYASKRLFKIEEGEVYHPRAAEIFFETLVP